MEAEAENSNIGAGRGGQSITMGSEVGSYQHDEWMAGGAVVVDGWEGERGRMG